MGGVRVWVESASLVTTREYHPVTVQRSHRASGRGVAPPQVPSLHGQSTGDGREPGPDADGFVFGRKEGLRAGLCPSDHVCGSTRCQNPSRRLGGSRRRPANGPSCRTARPRPASPRETRQGGPRQVAPRCCPATVNTPLSRAGPVKRFIRDAVDARWNVGEVRAASTPVQIHSHRPSTLLPSTALIASITPVFSPMVTAWTRRECSVLCLSRGGASRRRSSPSSAGPPPRPDTHHVCRDAAFRKRATKSRLPRQVEHGFKTKLTPSPQSAYFPQL